MKTHIINLVFLVALSFPLSAQPFGGGEANPELITDQEVLLNWMDLRFGMFIHWGPVTLRGTEIGWSRGPQVPIEEYDNLYKEFNPVLFDAKEWVRIVKEAGMKYLIITTKHHDGFCLWDSKYTEYDIASTPYKKDIIRELSDECKRQGILFGTYYSILDWHHPDYTTRYGGDPRPVESSDMTRYLPYLNGQVEELITTYGTNILWFDGQWEDSWTHEEGMKLYNLCRSVRNDILINNRVDKGRLAGKEISESRYAGDFGTPEQKIGEFNLDVPWESCITICQQWSWKPNDLMKSRRECLHTLALTAGGNGNLLLNVGPMMDGRIEQRQIDRLKEIGVWLSKNGASIYGTLGGPYKPEHWIASTHKENKIYIHLMKWPEEKLILPSLNDYKIKFAGILNGNELTFEQGKSEWVIKLPDEPVDPDITVLVIELNKPLTGIVPMDIPNNILQEPSESNLLLANTPSSRYSRYGNAVLLDKARGSINFNDGRWLGFEKEDFEVIVDLESKKEVKQLSIGCLQDQNYWIFFPDQVDFFLSDDGVIFKLIQSIKTTASDPVETILIKDFSYEPMDLKTRYIKIIAKNIGHCPPWHKGAGDKAWLFVDEILIK
jgi:alpha-L-fucosidase